VELERTVHGGHPVAVIRLVGAHVEPIGQHFFAVFEPCDHGLGLALRRAYGRESNVRRAPGNVRLQFGDELRGVVDGEQHRRRVTVAHLVARLTPVTTFAAQVHRRDRVLRAGGQYRGASGWVGGIELAPPLVLRCGPTGRGRRARERHSGALGGHGPVGSDAGHAGTVTDEEREGRISDAVNALPGQRRRVQNVDGAARVHATRVGGHFGYAEHVTGLPEVGTPVPDPLDGYRRRVGGNVTLDGDAVSLLGFALPGRPRSHVYCHHRRVLDVEHQLCLASLSQSVVGQARVRARVLGSHLLDDMRERCGYATVVTHPPYVVDAWLGIHVTLQRDGIVAFHSQRVLRSDLDARVV